MAKHSKPPAPIVTYTGGRLSPVSAFDAQEPDGYPNGTQFDLIARTKRSLPHHGLYWAALTRVVEVTGSWPSREALHTALKVRLGRVEPIFDLKGNVIGMRPDSTAFDAMNQKEFREYFDQAMAALSEAVGFDCLGFMDA